MASSRAPVPSIPSQTAIRRLSRDLQKLKEEPIEGIDAQPLEENILEWHYVIRGSKGTAFEGGIYHGKLVFPCEFPWKPPSIYMFTPNGRFLPNQRLCLSISDYHPETWNPGWTVSAILVGLHSFMNETSIATGTETTTPEKKKDLAVKSLAYNLRDSNFCKLFPSLVTEIQSKGIEKMSDAQANEETSRTMPRYARAALNNAGDADFMQNARQHMIQMQNEMEQAMRAAMRDPHQPPPAALPNPILPDDLMVYGGPRGMVQPGQPMQQQPQPGPPRPAMMGPPGPQHQWRMEPMMMQYNAVHGRPAVAVMGMQQQQQMPQVRPMPQQPQVLQMQMQAGPAAGPLRRAAVDDAGGLNPPPAKRIPDVVTLD